MTRYTVIIEPDAESDILAISHWIAARSPDAAAMWEEAIGSAILSLESMPRRCPLAPESGDFDREIRQLTHGLYRVLFTIRGATVVILHVRHALRRPLSPDDN